MAQRHKTLRLLRAAIVLTSLLIGLACAVSLTRFTNLLIPGRLDGHGIVMDAVALALLAVVIALAFGIPVLIGLVVRDWLLRRRLRHVLRDSGSCHACGYSLVGLYIPESLKLTCPECGFPCTVDESLTSLARNIAGATVAGSTSAGRMVIMEYPRFWTPERVRKWKRTTGYVTLTLLLLIGGVAGSYEYWVRAQAAQARAEAPTAADVTALIARHRPGAELVGAPLSIAAIMAIDRRMSEVNLRAWPSEERSPGVWPGFELVLAPPDDSQEEPPIAANPSDEARPLSRDIAMRLLAAYESEKLFDEFAAIRDAPREVRDTRAPPEQLFSTLLPYLSAARTHARILGARMLLAFERHDTPIAEESLMTMRALARVCDDQPTLVEHLVGCSIDSMAANRTMRWLASKPTAEELDAIDRTWHDQFNPPSAALAVDFEAISATAVIAATLGQPSVVRLAPFVGVSLLPWTTWPSQTPTRSPGTWEQNRDAIEAWRSDFAARSGLTFADRDRVEGTAPPVGNRPPGTGKPAPRCLADIVFIGGWRSTVFTASDMRQVQRAAITTMIALERWRLQHGTYPDSLSQLVPSPLPQQLTDGWSGKPFGYRRVDPSTDPLGRDYLLYSIGTDGVDDGGAPSPTLDRGMDAPPSRQSGPGTRDWQLNDAVPVPRPKMPPG